MTDDNGSGLKSLVQEEQSPEDFILNFCSYIIQFEHEIKAIKDVSASLDNLMLQRKEKLVRVAFQLYEDPPEFDSLEEIEDLDEEDLDVDVDGLTISELKDISSNIQVTGFGLRILPESLFASLVMQFDSFLCNILRAMIRVNPSRFLDEENELPLETIIQYEDVGKAVHHFIEDRIEGITHRSKREQIKWLENKLDVPLGTNQELFRRFIEINQRRNLIVHNDSKVSVSYINNCEDFKGELDGQVASLSFGEDVSVSKKYFERSANILFEFGYKLGQVCLRKILRVYDDLPNYAHEADEIKSIFVCKNVLL